MLKTFKIEHPVSTMVNKTTFFKVLSFIDTSVVETPCLVVDRERVLANASLIGAGIEGSRVFYAVKANPGMEVLRLLKDTQAGFEISSEGELAVLAELGVSAQRIISSNPVKTLRFLAQARAYGIEYYAFDSPDEVEKLRKYVPGAKVYVRLSIPNEGSEWPLSKKFGLEMDDALVLLQQAAGAGLDPVGITFHVGSQCNNIYNWNIALDKAKLLWDRAGEAGIALSVLNIGGGYPVKYTKDVLSIQKIEARINGLVKERFSPDITIHIEPGRAMVGDAGIIVASVTGKARRQDENWLYIDVGVFNGLMESIGGIRYSYVVETHERSGPRKEWVLAGPSCDSFDVIDHHVHLEEPEVGDLILVLSGGAYTLSYASEFNGCAIPKTIVV